jgi:PAS domain S-box-containing protein
MTRLPLPVSTDKSFYRTLVENLQCMAYRCLNHPELHMVYASEGCFNLLGIQPAALISGQPNYGSLIHPDDQAGVWQQIQESLQSRQPYNLHYRVCHLGSDWRWVCQLGRGVFSGRGHLLHLEGYITDITEYRRVAEALVKSERFSKAALDALAAHIAILDETGTIIQTNEAWDRFTLENGGQVQRVGVGANYLEVCEAAASGATEPPAQIAQAIRTILAGGGHEAFMLEYPCHSPEEQRWFYCRINRLPGDGAVYVVVAHEDISPVREMETALLASETRLRNTFEHAAMGIGHARSDGYLTQVNQVFCNIVGYTAEELLRISISELTHPEDRVNDQDLKNSLLRGEIPSYTLEKRYLQKNGDPVWVSVTASLIRDATGKPDDLIAIVENIHLRKLTELALQALNTNSNGEAFLQKVTHTLAKLLDVEFAFVTEMPHPSSRQMRTRALWKDDHFEPDFTFNLDGTACEAVIGEASPIFDEHLRNDPVVMPDRVQQRFPGDGRLERMGVQSYAGIALWSAVNAPLGTLAIMSRKPMRDTRAATALLQLLALRVGSELEREHEDKKFHDLFDSSPSAILMLDMQGTIHMANRACEDLFGWAARALLGQEVGILFPDQQQEAYMALYGKFIKSGLAKPRKSVSRDILAKRQDGSTFPVELFLSRLETSLGVMTVAYVHDITERKRAQERQLQLNQELESKVLARTQDIAMVNLALANKEEEIRSVVENMVDAVIGIDDRGIIISANPALTSILGYTLGEVLGRNVSMLMPEPHRGAHDGYLERYARTGEAHIIGAGRELRALHKNGELVDIELSVSEYLVRGNRFFTGTLHDIRDRVRIMQILEDARVEAEQSSRAKSSFLATMSHEIRTPMNGVIGMIEVLERSGLQDEQIETVKTIRESALALLTIIDDVLDFSKIEAGQFHVERIPISVAKVVEGVCDTLDQLASSKNVELTLFTDPAIPAAVLGDETRLRQVLLNLTGNAIKFSSGNGRTGGRVSVRAVVVQRDLALAMLELQVADNGIGMDPETQSKLFTPFTQADNSTTRRFGGTGLGLSISRRLAELMGGTINVQSEPNRGSLFTVCLPLAPANGNAAPGVALFDIAGLNCLVLGKPDGLTHDLTSYLTHGGANVVQTARPDAVRDWLSTQPSGLWTIVMDGKDLPFDEVRAICHARQGLDARFVRIERGKRRRPRLMEVDLVTLDGNVMHQRGFLEAVALATSRISAKPVPAESDEALTRFNSVTEGNQDLKGQHILVAEDNEINQKVILKQLSLLGISADVAGDGSVALRLWQQGTYPLLLTDLHMPEMDGYELTHAIRVAETGRLHMPIVALTANAIKGEAQQCRDAGMDDYLTKPVQLESLQATLSKWLSATPPSNTTTPVIPTPTTTTPAPSAQESAVDVNVLKALVGEDPDDIREFLHDFRLSAGKAAAEIDTAYQAGQVMLVGAVAHRLKSSARSVGALALGDLCAHLETAGKNVEEQRLADLIPRFKTEISAVEAYLVSLGA